MIEMTVQEIVNSIPMLKTINEKKMSAKVAYQFARIIKEVEVELKNFRETRTKLIERYGKKDEEGKVLEDADGNIIIFPDKKDAFNNEVDELLNTKITLNCEKIALIDLNNNNFTPSEIGEILSFIKE